MREITEEEIAAYVAKPYARILTPAEEGGYVAEILEIPGAMSEGDTEKEAVQMVNDALAGVIEVMLEDGETIPEPMGFNEHSGQFRLRVSSSVHREAAMRAQVEGISLNQWVGQAVVARLAGQSLADEVVEKLLAAMRGGVTSQSEFVIQEIKTTKTMFAKLGSGEKPAFNLTDWSTLDESPQERSMLNA